MLVLSCKAGEKVIIADGLISLTVLGIVGNTVRLGISAPRDINIVREEVLIRDGWDPAVAPAHPPE